MGRIRRWLWRFPVAMVAVAVLPPCCRCQLGKVKGLEDPDRGWRGWTAHSYDQLHRKRIRCRGYRQRQRRRIYALVLLGGIRQRHQMDTHGSDVRRAILSRDEGIVCDRLYASTAIQIVLFAIAYGFLLDIG